MTIFWCHLANLEPAARSPAHADMLTALRRSLPLARIVPPSHRMQSSLVGSLIDLAKGHPNVNELPHEALSVACAAASARLSGAGEPSASHLPFLTYGAAAGNAQARQALAAMLNHEVSLPATVCCCVDWVGARARPRRRSLAWLSLLALSPASRAPFAARRRGRGRAAVQPRVARDHEWRVRFSHPASTRQFLLDDDDELRQFLLDDDELLQTRPRGALGKRPPAPKQSWAGLRGTRGGGCRTVTSSW